MVFPSECCEIVEGDLRSEGPTCTFKHVYPDGDVHWFHGSHSLSDGSLHNTTKRVDEGGWLTIHSNLKWKSSGMPFNCSLKSTKSGSYIASTLVHNRGFPVTGNTEAKLFRPVIRNGVGLQRITGTTLCMQILLAVTLN